MKVICRPALSMMTIDESMERAKIFNSLKSCLEDIAENYLGSKNDLDQLRIQFWCDKDERVDWKDTYLVCGPKKNALCFLTFKDRLKKE